MNKFLSWLAIIFGIIYFFYESWYHIEFGQSNLALTADYISVLLLLIAGIVNLRLKKGIGLLCGAWGYTSCIMYRAFIWRMEAICVDELPNYETLQVKVLILALIVSFPAFIVSFVKSFPKKIPN
tara:strand:- start:186 stop:560 length:375 start_codon:yes stop_codon:yes gene_type:complete